MMDCLRQCLLLIFIYIFFNETCNGTYPLLTSSAVNATFGEPFSFICETDVTRIRFQYDTKLLCVMLNNGNSCTVPCNTSYIYTCTGNKTTLTIPKSQLSEVYHMTNWMCSTTANTPVLSNSLKMYVNIPVKDVTISPNSSASQIEIADGTEVPVTCKTNPGRPPAKIQWYLGEENLTTNASDTVLSCSSKDCIDDKFISTSVLTYSGTKNDNGKELFCAALNIDGRNAVKSKMKTVIIIYGPKEVSLQPTNMFYTVTEQKESVGPIICSADCKPNCTITWDGPNYSSTSVLHLQSIDRNQTGNYTCIAENRVNSIRSATITVIVNYGPRVVLLLPPNKTYNANETGSLNLITCTADCKPNCTIAWSGPNGFIVFTSILHLQNISRNHTGDYQCTASNDINNMTSIPVFVNVNYGPRKTDIFPSIISYEINETDSIGPINCSADCKPKCQTMWSGPNMFENKTAVLYLQNVDRKQAGNYKCSASNLISSMPSLPINVSVNYGPRQINISGSARSITVNETDDVGPIVCTSDCNPGCKIKWNGTFFSNETSSKLTLQNIDRSQAGIYQCTAYNFFDTIVSSISITVNYGPGKVQTSAPAQFIKVNETENLGNFYCSADCKPNCTIRWRGPNLNDDTMSVLELNDINRSQTGNYTCSASNMISTRTSDPFWIDVNYVPTVCRLSGNQTALENDTVFILCKYNSFPTPKIIWKFNNSSFNGRKHDIETNSSLHYSTLRLPKIECLSMGTYTCEAYNILGNDSKDFNVDVYCSPRIYSVEHLIAIGDGEPINITATVIAFPKPAIRWEFENNGSALAINNGIQNRNLSKNMIVTNLYISNVSETDFGYYKIYAHNDIGMVDEYIHWYNVMPAKKPNKAENVTCYGQTDAIVVNWKPGFNGGDRQFFRVLYQSLDDEEVFEDTNYHFESDDIYMSALIYHLTAETRYVFKVKACNKYNCSVSENAYCNYSKSVVTANNDSNLTAIGSGAGIGMAVLVIVIVVAIYIWKRRTKNTTDGLKDNILYESTGSDFNNTNKACGTTYGLDKRIREKTSSASDEHMETSLYSVVKKQSNLKAFSNGNNGERRIREDIYENVSDSPSTNSVKTNRDGLIYADLVFNKCGKGKKIIIHGIDNRTDYADIDLNLKADPLPSDESDKEEDGEINK